MPSTAAAADSAAAQAEQRPAQAPAHAQVQVGAAAAGSGARALAPSPVAGALFDWGGRAPPVQLVDIGVNLTDKSFAKDRDSVIARARAAGVAAMVVTGCCAASSAQAARLADVTADYPLFFTAGVHPHNAKGCDATTLARLEELAAHPRCVAIGECGLDFNRNFSPPAVQEEWFDAQVAVAVRLRKPLFMHCRDAAPRFADILRGHELTAPAVIHCFTGTAEELRQFLDLGLHIGVTGWVCDDRPERGGAELAALLPSIPADRLLIETDAPYLVPRTIKPAKARPRRNEPALLPHVLTRVSAALGQPLEQVAHQTTANAKAVFNIDF